MARQPERIVAHDVESDRVRALYHASPTESSIQGITVSPDGRSLVFKSFDVPTESASVKLVPTTGGAARDLMTAHLGQTIGGGAWTPDRTQVLVVKGYRDSEQPSELWKITVADGAAEQLELAMPGLRYVRLHPDGRHLAFNAGRREQEVWVIENLLPALSVNTADR